jgi:2-polyprenyl-6-methoxyphenol hydroxylase-like FAD-dependent oxidoreductase
MERMDSPEAGAPSEEIERVDAVIAGGGPAGLMLGLLLARQGIDVLVLEKHADFLRDFRGDTIHPSTLELLAQLDLADRFLALPHSKAYTLDVQLGNVSVTVADFRRLRSGYPYLAFVPQWDFLDFIASEARTLPTFRLEMSAEARDLVIEDGVVRGLRYATVSGTREVRAQLTVAADGRGSALRAQAGLKARDMAPPMDVLWFRLPRQSGEPDNLTLRVAPGRILLFINRRDYWQVAYAVPKGDADKVRAKGIGAFRHDIATLKPDMADRVDELGSWDEVKLLTVQSNRLTKWYREGFLAIGDAAHAMSPAGGVGINLAIQDAAAAANILGTPLRDHSLTEDGLRRVQRAREWPTKVIQRFQKVLQDRVIAPTLSASGGTSEVPIPAPVRLMRAFPALTGVTARLIGLGVRRVTLTDDVIRPWRAAAVPGTRWGSESAGRAG